MTKTGGSIKVGGKRSWRKALLNIGVALFALFLVWDNPTDIDGDPISQTDIKEYRVYIDGVLKATVPAPEVPVVGLGWGNKKSATVDMVLNTGEVSPVSAPLVRIVPNGGPGNKRIEDRP